MKRYRQPMQSLSQGCCGNVDGAGPAEAQLGSVLGKQVVDQERGDRDYLNIAAFVTELKSWAFTLGIWAHSARRVLEAWGASAGTPM